MSGRNADAEARKGAYDIDPGSLVRLAGLVRDDGNFNETRLADTLEAIAERDADVPPLASSFVETLVATEGAICTCTMRGAHPKYHDTKCPARALVPLHDALDRTRSESAPKRSTR